MKRQYKDMENCLTSRMNVRIGKPFDSGILVKTLISYLLRNQFCSPTPL
ncbi:MAG: hypothetical protein LBK73_09395 [Treponema sp.]|nr:hypothetical protein [Treponema sp.]